MMINLMRRPKCQSQEVAMLDLMRRRWHNGVKTHKGEAMANLVWWRCWNSCPRQVGCKSGSREQAKEAVAMNLTHRQR
jgi:hypothetical protein